jgi:Rrf2 family protein
MLSLTTKTQYGIASILDLAEHYGQGLVLMADIVKRRKIPRTYLVQILNQLAKQGIVRATRGKNGGFELCEHPDRLTLLQTLEALEGSIELSASAGIPALVDILAPIEEHIKQQLRVSISEVLQQEKLLSGQLMFQI